LLLILLLLLLLLNLLQLCLKILLMGSSISLRSPFMQSVAVRRHRQLNSRIHNLTLQQYKVQRREVNSVAKSTVEEGELVHGQARASA
jgi:hypothetical protein